MILTLAPFGCGASGGMVRATRNRDDYIATVRSAKDALPIAMQMEEFFPVADHFITEYAMFDSKPKTWNTEVFFGGRYTLTMQVDVYIDYKTNRIVNVVGEPKFWLVGTESVKVLPDGRAYHVGGDGGEFGADEWKKVRDAKGDFSVIGIKINREPAENFEEYVRQTRAPRIAVSLVDKGTK